MKQSSTDVFKNKDGAREEGVSHSRQIERKMTLDDWVVNWVEMIKPVLKLSTVGRYQAVMEKHILPDLGSLKLVEIDERMVRNFVNQKMNANNLVGSKQLSPKTVRDIVYVLLSSLRAARQENLIDRKVEVECLPKAVTEEPSTLNRREQIQLTRYILRNQTAANVGILIALNTGIRIGELCALKWKDIHLQQRTISITKTMQRVRNFDDDIGKTKILIDKPKSPSSKRKIPLPRFITELLQRQLGTIPSMDAYLITGKLEYKEPRRYQKNFKTVLRRAKIRDVHFHTLRHTFATKCVEAGFDIKALSRILGHTTVNLTLNRYVHTSFSVMEKNMDKLNSLYYSDYRK